MSYSVINLMATDPTLRGRVHAAILKQDVQEGTYRSPRELMRLHSTLDQYMYYFAAQPGWDSAWQYAIDTDVVDIGGDPAVITDGMILSAVTVIMAELSEEFSPSQSRGKS